jgi:uncharacterized protein
MTKEISITNDECPMEIRRPRHSSFVIGVLTLAIRGYQLTISPAQIFLFGAGSGCRFTPTCSQYALEAVHTHGVIAGGGLVIKRICRCHPWGEGGHDPVPERGIRPSALRFDAAGNAECGKTLEHAH